MSEEIYVPIEEFARQFTVNVATVRSWARQGLIPSDCYIKVGYTYRFCVPKFLRAIQKPKDVEPPKEVTTVPAPVQLELDLSPDKDL